jgi:hypothetical protein
VRGPALSSDPGAATALFSPRPPLFSVAVWVRLCRALTGGSVRVRWKAVGEQVTGARGGFRPSRLRWPLHPYPSAPRVSPVSQPVRARASPSQLHRRPPRFRCRRVVCVASPFPLRALRSGVQYDSLPDRRGRAGGDGTPPLACRVTAPAGAAPFAGCGRGRAPLGGCGGEGSEQRPGERAGRGLAGTPISHPPHSVVAWLT